MSSFLSVGKRLSIAGLCASLPVGFALQAGLLPQGGEYAIAGKRFGDQVQPQIAISSRAGLLVWQDNFTDGDGLGISAVRVSPDGLAAPSSFKINEQTVGDQENPQLTVLKGGETLIVWQGGVYGFQDIYARLLKSDGTFATSELRVNSFVDNQQVAPAVAALED